MSPTTFVSPRWYVLKVLGVCALGAFHFACFYWWIAGDYYFSGDALFYFSRQVGSFSEVLKKFASVDELYQYRPITYVFFSFVLHPLFGASSAPYHAFAYVMALVDTLLACVLVYFWTGKRWLVAVPAAVYLALNPINFIASFGPTYLDLLLSSFFYITALIVILKNPLKWRWITPILFLLALCAKEQSVVLPAHALLLLVTLGCDWKQALRRTQWLWVALAAFVVFQLGIRNGSLYAPEGQNQNLRFELSFNKIVQLAKGAKPAFFYPENYRWDDVLFGNGRLLRLLGVVPWVIAFGIALQQRNMLAISGLVWAAVSLLPVAFIHLQPFPRHYYLALPGIAVFFASLVQTSRVKALLVAALAVSTISNVKLYADQHWVAAFARMTRHYMSAIKSTVEETGRTEFYVMEGGDPHFYWHTDGGMAVPHILGRHLSFQFASLQQPMALDSLFKNRLNLIVALEGELKDPLVTGLFPLSGRHPICAVTHELMGSSGPCFAIFQGIPVSEGQQGIAETPSGLPVFLVNEGVVTISYSSLIVDARSGLRFKRRARLVPESRDGVVVELYLKRNRRFELLKSSFVAPGQSIDIDVIIAPNTADQAALRISRGPQLDSSADWLIWNVTK